MKKRRLTLHVSGVLTWDILKILLLFSEIKNRFLPCPTDSEVQNWYRKDRLVFKLFTAMKMGQMTSPIYFLVKVWSETPSGQIREGEIIEKHEWACSSRLWWVREADGQSPYPESNWIRLRMMLGSQVASSREIDSCYPASPRLWTEHWANLVLFTASQARTGNFLADKSKPRWLH